MKQLSWLLLLLGVATGAVAAEYRLNGVEIARIRVVGDYPHDEYDQTIELWFKTPLNWPAGSACPNTQLVYVDARHQHMISAAYMAFASSSTLDIVAETTLPIRNGACELSYFDVVK